MADALSLRFDGDLIADLDRLEAALQEHVYRAVAHAGAVVYYDEARHLVPVQSGKLRDSIYRVFAEDLSDATTKVYEISWNHSKAPHGWLVENGHVFKMNVSGKDVLKRTRAVGFIRRAGDRSQAALAAMQQRAVERVQEILSAATTADSVSDAGVRG